MSGRKDNTGKVTLPDGWRRIKQPRPTYRRRDGFVVKMDGTASWGIRAPGEAQPFRRMVDQQDAMAWVDAEYPLEPVGSQ